MKKSISLYLPSPSKYFWLSVLLILPTIALGALSILVSNTYQTETAAVIYETFWVGEEGNIPTFVNFALLNIAAGLVFLVASKALPTGDRWRWHWLAFAFLLFLMGFDEAAQVHEPVGAYVTQGIDGRGFFAWTWVLVGLGIVAIIGALGYRFVRALERNTRAYVLLAAGVFFGGALGMEMISAFLHFNDMENGRYVTLTEEFMEMTGAALFGSAALAQLKLEQSGDSGRG